MDREIRRRLEKLEDSIEIENQPSVRDYTPEELQRLREIARRVIDRMRKNAIEPGDEEVLKKVTAEVVREMESEGK